MTVTTVASVSFGHVWEMRDSLLSGVGTMLMISVIAFGLSIVGGLLLAWMRLSPSRPIRVIGFLLIQVLRGIALYVLLLWMFFGLAASSGFQFNLIPAGILALSLLNSAYLAEIFRAGFASIPAGQKEAAMAIGLSRRTWFFRIHLPQVFRVTLAAMGNVLVDIVKDTSVLSVIGVAELLRESQRWAQFYDQTFEFYTAAAAVYFVIVMLITIGWRRIERYASRHLRIASSGSGPRTRLLGITLR